MSTNTSRIADDISIDMFCFYEYPSTLSEIIVLFVLIALLLRYWK